MGKVLVTGGNGFIAEHIILRFLATGHSVIATVRSTEKADQARGSIPEIHRSRIEFCLVESSGSPGAFDKVIAVNDIDAVIHTATPFYFNIGHPRELIDPTVNGTKNLLEAILKHGKSVTRVILLSSVAAVFDFFKSARPGHIYSEMDFNPITEEQALSGNPIMAYLGAKTLAENTAWKFMETHKPRFSFTVICPPLVFGPIAHKVHSKQEIGNSNIEIWNLVDGSQKEGEIQPATVWGWVDVRDVAEAHLQAYEKSDLPSGRFIIAAGNLTNKDLVDAIKAVAGPSLVNNLPTKLAPGLSADGRPKEGLFGIDNKKSIQELGIKYRRLQDAVQGFLQSVQEILA